MSYELRTPNISAQTTEGQLRQLSGFLMQHIGQLNWILRSLEAGEEPEKDRQEAAVEAVLRSAEVFNAFCGKLRRKQARENFLGAGKRTILEGGSWAQGTAVDADTKAVGLYTLFVAVAGDTPVVCCRYDGAIRGDGLRLDCGEETLTVTETPGPLTALYAII